MSVGVLCVGTSFEGQVGDHHLFLVFFLFPPSLPFLFHLCSIPSLWFSCEFHRKEVFPWSVSLFSNQPVTSLTLFTSLLCWKFLSSFTRHIKNKKLVHKHPGRNLTRKELAKSRCPPARPLPPTCWDSTCWNVDVTHRYLSFPVLQSGQPRTGVSTLGPKTYLVKF